MSLAINSEPILSTKDVGIFYGENQAVRDVSFSVSPRKVYALIGPSGCGKSTLLRCFNRMNDFVNGFRMSGTVCYQGHDIYDNRIDPVVIRKRIGMVFQKPNPFPGSISKNITWGPKLNGYSGNTKELVRSSLEKAGLWDEVKDRLDESGLSLSGGQQQRLCIARTIAMEPDVILMDEPCASLDPKSTLRIEELIEELKKSYTIIIVTHNMHQAKRISDYTAFMYEGRLIEFGETNQIFEAPKEELTQNYVQGAFG